MVTMSCKGVVNICAAMLRKGVVICGVMGFKVMSGISVGALSGAASESVRLLLCACVAEVVLMLPFIVGDWIDVFKVGKGATLLCKGSI